jgi:hypothetical protein
MLLLLCGAYAALTVHTVAASNRPPLGPVKVSGGVYNSDRNLLSKCDLKWFNSTIDHFSAVSLRAYIIHMRLVNLHACASV